MSDGDDPRCRPPPGEQQGEGDQGRPSIGRRHENSQIPVGVDRPAAGEPTGSEHGKLAGPAAAREGLVDPDELILGQPEIAGARVLGGVLRA